MYFTGQISALGYNVFKAQNCYSASEHDWEISHIPHTSLLN